MEIFFKDKIYNIPDDKVSHIKYFDTHVAKINYKKLKIFWCPLNYKWMPLKEKEKIEKKHWGYIKLIHYDDKEMYVDLRDMRRCFPDGVETEAVLLPIGYWIYWNQAEHTWSYLSEQFY